MPSAPSHSHLSHAYPITNTTTEIINGDIDPTGQQVYFTNLTPWGPRIFIQSSLQETKPPAVENMLTPPYGSVLAQPSESVQPRPPNNKPSKEKKTSRAPSTEKTTDEAPISAKASQESLPPHKYRPFTYLLPRYWLPMLYPIEDGFLFQGITSAADPLQRHNYTLSLASDTVTQKVGGGFNYFYSTGDSRTGISYLIQNEPFSISGENPLTHKYGRIYKDFYIPGLSHRWQTLLAGELIKTDQPSTPAIERTGGSVGLHYSNLFELGRNKPSPGSYSGSFSYSHYKTKGLNERSYGRTAASFIYYGSHFLPDSQDLILRSQVAFAPQLTNLTIGDRTVGNTLATLINSSFLVRGYPSGNFFGRKIVNLNLEYNTPLLDIFEGRGSHPFFLKQLHGGLFIDYVAVDGFFANGDTQLYERVSMDRSFLGTGAEFKLSTTIGYHFPLDFVLGLYYGLDKEARGGFTPFMGIGFNGQSLTGAPAAIGGLPSTMRDSHPYYSQRN